MSAEIKTTIDNLRELAGHAERFDSTRFCMRDYISNAHTHKSGDVGPDQALAFFNNECGSVLCLIGVAAINSMGDINTSGYWSGYYQSLFPALPEANAGHSAAFCCLFGSCLKNELSTRINALRLAANMLEENGVIDAGELPE